MLHTFDGILFERNLHMSCYFFDYFIEILQKLFLDSLLFDSETAKNETQKYHNNHDKYFDGKSNKSVI